VFYCIALQQPGTVCRYSNPVAITDYSVLLATVSSVTASTSGIRRVTAGPPTELTGRRYRRS